MKIPVCPICILVSGVWIVLLVLMRIGYEVDPAFPAMLMGGSVVGIAYTLGLGKWQKFVFIPVGFLAMWSLLASAWLLALLAVLVCAVVWVAVDKSGDKILNCC